MDHWCTLNELEHGDSDAGTSIGGAVRFRWYMENRGDSPCRWVGGDSSCQMGWVGTGS